MASYQSGNVHDLLVPYKTVMCTVGSEDSINTNGHAGTCGICITDPICLLQVDRGGRWSLHYGTILCEGTRVLY